MKTIGRFFLRARHWQLFSLFMGLYFVGVAFVFAGDLGAAPNSGGISVGLIAMAVLMIFWMLCIIAWIGSMGIFLNTLKEPSVRPRTRLLWFALVYTSLYIFVFVAFFFSSSSWVSAWAIVPPHLLAMYCLFYTMYFASKGLAMVETARPVTFYDYAGPLFLIWFFPLGVWFLQPRINRLHEQSKNPQAGIGAGAPE